VPDLTNAQIAAAFDELGDLYELDGAVSYRVIAYHTAAKAVRDSPVSVMGMTREGRVTELPGIGKTLEEKIRALDETGDIPAAVKLRAKFPVGLLSVMHLPASGPSVRGACTTSSASTRWTRCAGPPSRGRSAGCAASAPAWRRTCCASWPTRRATAAGRRPACCSPGRSRWPTRSSARLRAVPGAERVEIAGSLRRQADTVKDLDIIATASDPAALAASLADLALVESVQSTGDAGARVTLHAGFKVDLKVVEPDQFGNVLQHFTGAKAHNVAMRESAVRRGLHVSEYGILDDATGETLRCATEEEVYATLGLEWIPPELREGRGELEAAAPAVEASPSW